MKEFLVDKIVCWPGCDPCSHQDGRPPGVGIVLEIVNAAMLVRTLPYFTGDFEPAHMLVLPLHDTTLLFFDSVEDWRIWQHWLDNTCGDDSDPKIIAFRRH